ncbi:MAG: hypothetical protein Q9186_005759 [Xanthomendoza sp. 1 TL-2023]
MTDLNYFTCTLGQAVEINEKSPNAFGTITNFLDHQARKIPRAPAVAFPLPSRDNSGTKWKYEIFIYDDVYTDLAQASAEVADHRLLTVPIPTQLAEKIEYNRSSGVSLTHSGLHVQGGGQRSTSNVAFLFHTSGTSSGLPKPIPQSHRGSIGVLPCLPNGGEKATFTTTPLYHGGIADCFRAWTSGGLIWLFPGKDVPITPSNILKSLDCAKRAEGTTTATSLKIPPAQYFSSVPYVLQMLSAEPAGISMLQNMDIVGVGGAALPQAVGDSLVHQDVNVVSRFGSAECGFLLSSHRDYPKDKNWQYLRSYGSILLNFEKQQDDTGLSELVIRPEWPHMAKRNREDGSFATADLFEPHPTIRDAWRYHSRADSQLTLITGKKFDPAPLEAAIASGESLSDVLIFGNGMQSAGALLFRSEKTRTMDASQVLDETWPAIDQLNKDGQAHTRLSRSMLIVMDSQAPGLEKSSKGTIMRAQAEKAYEKEIRSAYEQSEIHTSGIDSNNSRVPQHEIPTAVLDVIKSVLGKNDPIPEDADLFSYGVDSVACMAIRAKLQSRIIDPEAPALPLNVVYDCGNIKRLSRHLLDLRTGRQTESEDEIQLMNDLVTQYGKVVEEAGALNKPDWFVGGESTQQSQENKPPGERILLTGATGALGAHILHILRSSPTVSHITCLVRATSPFGAHERVSKSLIVRGKPGLPPYSDSKPISSQKNKASSSTSEVNCIPTILSHRYLGLDPSTYVHLASTTTLIIHAAWAVNFTARLRSFEKDHIAGLSHLLNLTHADSRTNQTSKRFLFLSSTASITNTPTANYPIAEHISTDPTHASPLGYSRSKWVAENICADFYNRRRTTSTSNSESGPRSEKSKVHIAVLRIGQLTSDTICGIWNTSEAYPLMLSTAPILHALPDLGNLPLDWLPVDIAATAVLEIAEWMKKRRDEGVEGGERACPVFHILNPSITPTWGDLVAVVRKSASLSDLGVLAPREWVGRVEGWEGDLQAKRLVGVWREGFEGEEGGGEKMVFALEKAREGSEVIRGVGPLDEGFLGRMWGWIEGEVVGGKGG